uniref:Uncharacterized protein n=1 Tax=Cacopsylla melanoneura TaxID=428564 RepID=A0A8D8M1Y8_9HEMI
MSCPELYYIFGFPIPMFESVLYVLSSLYSSSKLIYPLCFSVLPALPQLTMLPSCLCCPILWIRRQARLPVVRQLVKNVKSLLPPAAQKSIANLLVDFKPLINSNEKFI